MRRALPEKEEARRVRAAAFKFALSITQSTDKASEVVQEAFAKVLEETRPWDAGRVSFEDHVLGVVRSLLSNEHRSAAGRHARAAAEGFHDEVVGRRIPSLEEQLVEREEVVARDGAFESLLDRLALRVEHDDVLSAVLRCRRQGIEKPVAIAESLGVSADSVYRANEMLRSHLQRIVEADHG